MEIYHVVDLVLGQKPVRNVQKVILTLFWQLSDQCFLSSAVPPQLSLVECLESLHSEAEKRGIGNYKHASIVILCFPNETKQKE